MSARRSLRSPSIEVCISVRKDPISERISIRKASILESERRIEITTARVGMMVGTRMAHTASTVCELFKQHPWRQYIKSLRLLAVATLGLALAPMLEGQGVLTRSADNLRSGSYRESIITVENLKQKGVTLRTTIPVIGDARGMEAQPLILPGVKLADGSVHDVMVLPSMANVVRGVDAHTGVGLWQVSLGNPVQGGPSIDMHRINDKWGVLSTPVIDPQTQTVYMVAWISPDGSPQRGLHWMYALDVATGKQRNPPVSFSSLASGSQRYADTMRKQRSSLVLVNEGGHPVVFGAYGTVLETGRYSAGAIFAYDTVMARFTAFMPMSQGLGAGVWMGGQGLAADAVGDLYGVSGNGSFNAVTEFGESIFKVHYTFGVGTAPASMKIVTWFSPYSDAGRVGLDPKKSGPAAPSVPDKMAGVNAPDEAMGMPVGASMTAATSNTTHTVLTRNVNTGQVEPLVYPNNPTAPGWSDEDLGSGGCTLLEGYGFLLCGGKDGLGYLTYTGNMGNTVPSDFGNAKANCAKLASPPIWMTASPGPVDPCPQQETMLNFMPYGKTRHLHMTPVQYMSPIDGLHLFVWGENSALHDWHLAQDGTFTYVAESRETASAASTQSPGGMPGGFCSLSSDHNKLGTAVLWCSIPYGDANSTLTGGRLIAYDPEIVSRDGDGPHLVKLWDSQDWGIGYRFNKFMPPVIWEGEVILPNFDGGVMVFTE